jgi:DnaJ-class molecular chaperone
MKKMVVYPRGEEVEVSEQDIKRGATRVECSVCEGAGEFFITDFDYQECVSCKGTGEVFVSV